MEAVAPPRKRGRSLTMAAFSALGAATFLLSSSSSSDPLGAMSSSMRRVLREEGAQTVDSKEVGNEDGHTSYEMCFVKSVYAPNPQNWQEADVVPHISSNFASDYPQIGFFVFTNIVAPEYAPGWTKLNPPQVLSQYSRTISQSRYGKFMSWQQPEIGQGRCRAVVYSDGFHAIRELDAPSEQNESRQVFKSLHSSVFTETPTLNQWIAIAVKLTSDPAGPGIMQQKHFMTKEKLGGPHARPYWWIDDEINAIRRVNKDTKKNMDSLRMWLRSDNYNSESDVYLNDFFIFDPSNINYQRLSQAFWDVYSTESYGWRDQPLWAHFLDKLGMTPLPLADRDIAVLKDVRRDGQKGFRNHGIAMSYSDMTTKNSAVSRRLDERDVYHGRADAADTLAAEESMVSMLA